MSTSLPDGYTRYPAHTITDGETILLADVWASASSLPSSQLEPYRVLCVMTIPDTPYLQIVVQGEDGCNSNRPIHRNRLIPVKD